MKKDSKCTINTRTKMSNARIGDKNPMFGVKRSIETIQKIVNARKMNNSFKHSVNWCLEHSNKMKGKNNPAYKGGISNSPYFGFNNRIKNETKKRDEDKCIHCKNIQRLTIHHVDYNKLNTQLSNLVTLCGSCHSKTNFNRKMWQEFFTRTYLTIFNYEKEI